VPLRRTFKDAQGAWQSTSSLRPYDLLPAALALWKAYEFIEEGRSKGGKRP